MPEKLFKIYKIAPFSKRAFLLFLLNVCLSEQHLFAQNNISFKNITINDGLPHSDITAIAQDKLGFMWFGTYNGLCRYDGYTFDTYKYDRNNKKSISNNRILSICASKNGNLWIGTEAGGLNLYDYNTGNFVAYKFSEHDSTSLSHNAVHCVFEDSDLNIWSGTENGLNKLDIKTQKIQRFLNNLTILNIVEDRNNILWIASNQGLIKFNRESFSYKIIQKDGSFLQANTVFIDASARIWVAFKSGVYLFEPGYEIFTKKWDYYVMSIFQDKNNNIWYGTQGDGVLKYNPENQSIIQFRSDKKILNSLINNEVKAIVEDRSGCLWFGTLGGGISKYSQNSKNIYSYKHLPGQPNSLKTDAVTCFFEDEQNRIWVATRGHGINILDKNREKWIFVENNKNGVSGFDNLYPSAFYQDKNGSLWVGTWNGIYLINKQ
ncbi:MAG: two-component regulator propeller domain-containing protein, partial [Bacteroidales bacterium]|nr:two-component regulator propeller domain-containing protein [Bacteroidales bacterium]